MIGDQVNNDPINHPKHYNAHPSGIEAIEVTEHFNFNTGNAIKYLWRAGSKKGSSRYQDLAKAKWYVEREMKLELDRVEKADKAES